MRTFVLSLLMMAGAAAHAGFIELGASVNYRSSGYDDNNYIRSLSYTGSFSYYFYEMCAWELNYTIGQSEQVTKGPTQVDQKYKVEDNIQMVSMDLVLSFASRQDPFRPYIKFGAGYLTKERFRQIDSDPREKISEQSGVVPSGGIGFSLNVTKEFSFKLGVDAWTSPLEQEPLVIDYAGRAGIAFMF
jgi:outer membrane protein W